MRTLSVTVTNSVIPTAEQGRAAILEREHDLLDMYVNLASATGTVGSVTNNTSPVVPYGFQAVIYSITIMTDGPVSLSGYLRKGEGSSGNAKAASQLQYVSGPNGGSTTFNFGPDGITLFGGGHLLIVKTLITTTSPNVRVFSAGKLISDDRNYTAPYVLNVLGNSISWGTMGSTDTGYPNMGKLHYTRRLAASLRTVGGIDVRVSLRGFGGSQARDWIRQIDAGVYDDQPFSGATIIQLATNEAADGDASLVQGSSGMTYSQMMEKIIDFVLTKNPTESIFLIGPPHSSTTPRITNLASFRVATQNLVSLPKYAGKKLYYYDASSNIPAPVTANDPNYVEVGVGTHVHLRGDTGHALFYQGLWPIVQQSDFYARTANQAKPLKP